MRDHRAYVWISVLISAGLSIGLLLILKGISFLLAAMVGMIGLFHALPGNAFMPPSQRALT